VRDNIDLLKKPQVSDYIEFDDLIGGEDGQRDQSDH
jgi:hypothetical protein